MNDKAAEDGQTRTDGGQTDSEGPLSPGGDDRLPGGSVQTGQPEELSNPETFDWRGWLLVGVVFVSFLVIPGVILFLPETHQVLSNLGFSWRQAYLVFPMIPAILLGFTAVWAALRSQSS